MSFDPSVWLMGMVAVIMTGGGLAWAKRIDARLTVLEASDRERAEEQGRTSERLAALERWAERFDKKLDAMLERRS